MHSEEPMLIVGVISIYLFAALFVLLWGALTTKITFSMVKQGRYVLRTVVWFVMAWPLALVFYIIFLVGAGGAAIVIDAILKAI